jgi:hypothetical protein
MAKLKNADAVYLFFSVIYDYHASQLSRQNARLCPSVSNKMAISH